MHDVMMAPDLLSAAGPITRLIADKAYDTNQLRNLLVQLDIDAVIPSIARRKPLIPHDREAYRQRNLIERVMPSGNLRLGRHNVRGPAMGRLILNHTKVASSN